jgi:hypothetical protein
MQTTIKSVDVEWVGSGAKKYGKAKVTHVGDKGEKTQYLVSFKNPEVFKKVQELVGQTVEVDLKKDGDFWQWVSIQNTTAGSAAPTGGNAPAAGTRVSGSNYETKEERAARQVLIVKQSSLSVAKDVLIHNAGKDKVVPEAVKELAQNLTDWVFEKAEDKSGFDSMDDDIPF